MKKSEVTEIVIMLVATYSTARGDATSWARTVAVYERMLEDLDVEVARKAVQRLITTSRFLPTIAEIRETAFEIVNGPARTGEEAFAIVLRAIREVGQYQAPVFDDELIVEALGVWGGWEGACNSPENDPGGRARFVELYDALAAARRLDAISGVPLPRTPQAHAFTVATPEAARLPPAPPVALVPRLGAAPPRPAVSPIEGRRFTAEEIDEQLKRGKADER